MALSRVSPLAVPVLLDIGRESVRSGDDEEALLAEAEAALVAEAMGEAEPPPAPPRPLLRAFRASRPTRTPAPPARAFALQQVAVTAAPIHLAGERLMLDPAGALFWPCQGFSRSPICISRKARPSPAAACCCHLGIPARRSSGCALLLRRWRRAS